MKNKAAYLIVLCCLLQHMSVIGSDIALYHTVAHDGTLVYLLSQAVAYLLYPLLGWLADVYFTRYKFVLLSSIINPRRICARVTVLALSLTLGACARVTVLALSLTLGACARVTVLALSVGLSVSSATEISDRFYASTKV